MRVSRLDSPSPSEGAILGVDYGLRRVGLSLSPAGTCVAVGAGVIEGLSGRRLVREVYAAAKGRNAAKVVIGLPSGAGRDTDRVANGAASLANSLEKMGLKVVRWDESYTTSAALSDRKRIGGRSSAGRGWADEAAAVLILQGYIDSLK